jgi:hypothetical protein
MNLAWTTSEFGRTAESTHENFFASISRDALTRWFASGSSRDSPVAQEFVAVLRSELLASLEQHGPKATLALVMSSWGANPPDTLRIALMKLRITQQGSLPVAETGRVLGLVTEENLRNYISMLKLLFAPCP